MSIINFTIPSDSKILEDIEINNIEIKFIGLASVTKTLKKQYSPECYSLAMKMLLKKQFIKRKEFLGVLNP